MDKNNHIEPEALVRYLSGESTPDERKNVDQWRSLSTSNEEVFREYKKIWEADHHTLLSKDDLFHDWEKIRNRIRFEKPNSRPTVLLSLARIAAVFVVMLAVSAALYTYWNVPGFGRWSAFHTEDQIDSMQLPDNSVVFLNHHSSLKYLKNFNDGKRKVTLDGEGYFDVTDDPGNPFLVHTPEDVEVQVMGTSFHLNSGRGFDHLELNVTEGTVQLNYRGGKKIVNEGYSALSENQLFQVVSTPDNNFLSWKTGELKFSQASLASIAETLQEHFDAIEKLDLNTRSDVQVTTTFKDQPLSDILSELEMHFDKKFRMEEGVLTISD